ncbi:MAG: hypothetical protein HZB27_14610 [Meiothermus silvanus]|nr:hypothetical protein [Allomeiothermus silvanus]
MGSIARNLAEEAKERFEQAKDQVGDYVEAKGGLGGAVKDLAEQAKDKAQDTVESVRDRLGGDDEKKA